MSRYISRSTFLKGLALLAVGGSGKLLFDLSQTRRDIPCKMLGPSQNIGHKIRDSSLGISQQNVDDKRAKVVIVGGGVAGLSAGWWLLRSGVDDFVILELENEVGGNACSGRNHVSAYPWGAHYVPLANSESSYVIEFFKELGVITGTSSEGHHVYNEEMLCHDPEERLLKGGVFQEGLVPKRGLQPNEKQQIARFFETVTILRNKVGVDKRPAFAIPVDLSSQDEEFTALDKISMAEWLKRNSFDAKPLMWYVEYCCRDDYGSSPQDVSAWAGLHYFAGRRGSAANAEPNWVVTWPEGNGYLIAQLKKKLAKQIITSSAVFSIDCSDNRSVRTSLVSTDSGSRKITRYSSEYAVFCAPRFIANHIVGKGTKSHDGHHIYSDQNLSYAPWMVANITLRGIPDARGAALAWDNVNYNSPSLGYVVATHQQITTRPGPTVVTWYYPLSDEEPRSARRRLQQSNESFWKDFIIADLERMHPGVSEDIESIQLWPWGHGMVRPSVGFIWGEYRKMMQQPLNRLYYAHSDMSGISNFEEAQYRGVTAATEILKELRTA